MFGTIRVLVAENRLDNRNTARLQATPGGFGEV
jgi:hypothetical protein